MTGLSERPAYVREWRALTRWNLGLHQAHSRILRYGFAVVCIAVALGLALILQYYGFREESPLFNLAIALTTWYAGVGPSVLAVLLSTACFSYLLGGPIYAVYFVAWAVIIASFARHEEQIRTLNQELAKRAAELEAANKELESFAYSVSHDLRAPLRHVVGYAELLQKHLSTSLDDKGRRYMAMILDAAKRMGILIDDLLGFSRIGRSEARKTAVGLDQLVREVIAELARDTKDRDVAWTVRPLPVCYGDRSMLKVVVMNLLSNAVKFTRMRPQGKIEIGCVDGKDNSIEVFVADNGAGFDMQYVNKLFGVFQRLHRTEEFEGTGIGLATVQRIIHRHGGNVWAHGAVGQGATFHFSLPRA